MRIPALLCSAVLTLTSSSCSKKKDDVATEGSEGDEAPAPTESPGMSAERAGEIDQVLAQAIEFTDGMALVFAQFEGDCDKLAESAMALEPKQQAFARAMETVADLNPEERAYAEQARAQLNAQQVARLTAKVEELGLTPADVTQRSQQVGEKCADHEGWIAAQETLGLRAE